MTKEEILAGLNKEAANLLLEDSSLREQLGAYEVEGQSIKQKYDATLALLQDNQNKRNILKSNIEMVKKLD